MNLDAIMIAVSTKRWTFSLLTMNFQSSDSICFKYRQANTKHDGEQLVIEKIRATYADACIVTSKLYDIKKSDHEDY